MSIGKKPNKPLDVVMVGSAPMSLHELALAPAMISSVIKRRGHDFAYLDINLSLFNLCDRQNSLYEEKIERLQKFNRDTDDDTIKAWLDPIIQRLVRADVVLVNVFSHYSQSVALEIVQRVRDLGHNMILVGGIGSQKKILNADNVHTQQWIKQRFARVESPIFGQLLLDNHLVDAWQSDTTTSEIERLIPDRFTVSEVDDIDFSVYDIDQYQWQGRRFVPVLGSYGCVRQCTFCDVIKHYPRYQFVEADALTKQIVSVYNQTGISKFSFMDSLVNGSMSNFEDLLRNLAHSRQQGWLPEDFSWSGTYICRPKSVQLDRIHHLLKPSGAETLVIGVETGSDRVRFEMDKKFTNDDLIAEMSAFSAAGIRTQHLFFPAWPTETEDDVNETLSLLRRLQPFAFSGTLDSVSLGTSGFTLIDGTHIDRDKHVIGLESGPTPFLWRCRSNPGLNFWESLRRRLAMSAYCEHLGIITDYESSYVRFLAFSLEQYRDVIREYAGPLDREIIDHDRLLETLPGQHRMCFTVENSGNYPITMSLSNNQGTTEHVCRPGFTKIDWRFDKPVGQQLDFCIRLRFDPRHETTWARHPNGDYYDVNGVYLNNIHLDQRDITLWGFNQLVTQDLIDRKDMPADYVNHVNQRCVTGNTDLRFSIGAGVGIHAHLLRTLNPELHQEYQFARRKLMRALESHA